MPSFLILSSAFKREHYEKCFRDAGFIPYQFNKKLDFLHIDSDIGYKNKHLLEIPVRISNQNTTDTRKFFTNKRLMHKTISDCCPKIYKKHVPEHWDFDLNDHGKLKHLFDGKKMYIIKPALGTMSEQTTVVKTYSQLVKDIHTNDNIRNVGNKIRKVYNYEKFVLSEYNSNPLLLDGFTGVYRLSVISFKGRHFVIKKVGLIYRPLEKFSTSDLHPIKHLTGYAPIVDGKILPRNEKMELEKTIIEKFGKKKLDAILKQMYNILGTILRNYETTCKDKSENCYTIWSVDFGITKDYIVKLYELNASSPDIVYGGMVKGKDYFKYFFETLYDCVLAPEYKLKPKYKKSYVEI